MRSWQLWHVPHKKPVLIDMFEGPFFVWVLDRLSWAAADLCDKVERLKLPKFLRQWERKWGGVEEVCTYEDYYGASLEWIWHCHIEQPLFRWAYKFDVPAYHTQIEISLKEGRELFGDRVKWIEEQVANHILDSSESEPILSK